MKDIDGYTENDDILFCITKGAAESLLEKRGSGSSRKEVQVYWAEYKPKDPDTFWETIRTELSNMYEEMNVMLEAAIEEALEEDK